MADKDYNSNKRKGQLHTSYQNNKQRKKQDGRGASTPIAIPSRDLQQRRETPFSNPTGSSSRHLVNKTTRYKSDHDNDFMEHGLQRYLNNAAAISRKRQPRESKSVSFDIPSSSSEVRTSKFTRTKQVPITVRKTEPDKLLEVIRSKTRELDHASTVTHKHKVFGNNNSHFQRELFRPFEDEDDEGDKSAVAGLSTSSNATKTGDVIEIDSDEELEPSRNTKRGTTFDFLKIGIGSTKPTDVVGLPKLALTSLKPKLHSDQSKRFGEHTSNKASSASELPSKPKVISLIRGANESTGYASTSKSNRVDHNVSSSLRPVSQSTFDSSSRKHTGINTPFTTPIRQKKPGLTTSTTPLCPMPPVNIPPRPKPISTSFTSSARAPSLIHKKASDTPVSSASAHRPIYSTSNTISNTNPISKLAKTFPVQNSLSAKTDKQHQKQIINLTDSSSDSDNDDDFKSAPTSPAEEQKPEVTPDITNRSSSSNEKKNANMNMNMNANKEKNKDGSTHPVTPHGSPSFSGSKQNKSPLKSIDLNSDDDLYGSDNNNNDDEDDFVDNNNAKRKIEEVEEISDSDDDRKKAKTTPEKKTFFNAFAAKKSNTTTDTASTSTTASSSKYNLKGGISDFISKNNFAEEIQRSLKDKIFKRSVATPIEVPKKNYSPPKEETSTVTSSIPLASYLPTGNASKEILVYPFSGKKAAIICNSDVSRLTDDRFLNDCVMNIYPTILQDELPRQDIHTFSTFFFTRLTDPDDTAITSSDTSDRLLLPKATQKTKEPIKYERIRRWTDKINIFDMKYLIIPIAQNHHWFLAIITNPGCCDGTKDEKNNEILIAEGVEESISPNECYVTFLDSLSFDHDDCYEQICDYLKEEAITRLNIDSSKFKIPKHIKGRAPIQKNNSDCGVHCLQCIKRIFQEPDQIQQALITPEITNDKLWNAEEITGFRTRLAALLLEKAKEYAAYLQEQKKES